jgi:hypothetical protein
MELDKIIELLSYTIPSAVTGVVAYYFFVNHTKNEERKLRLAILRENQKQSLPIKLQAYERMTLFMERINPSNLLIRITSINNDKAAYAKSLINTIDQEYEHNITQQIYISEECWSIIIASKNAIKQLITKSLAQESIKNAQELREFILTSILNNNSPATSALTYIKDEVKDLI